MTSCALSARRQVLRRPKVCFTPPNPGRCQPLYEEPPPPPLCPPLALAGFFELAGKPFCHGANHHYDFVATRYSEYEDPWHYKTPDYPITPGSHCHFSLYQTPFPAFYAVVAYVKPDRTWCATATKPSIPFVWCEHQSFVIDDWTTISQNLTCHLEVSW